MRKRPERTTWLVIFLVVAHAAGLLCFRFFLTLDGPMHVLHACVLKSQWFSGRYSTATIDYWMMPASLDLGDVVMLPLTWALSPLVAHAVFGALLLLALCAGAYVTARSSGQVDPALFLWVLPLSFSFIFILGFFPFLLASSLALLCVGWWMQREKIRWRTLLVLFLFVAACQFTHRSGGPLAILFVGCHELISWLRDRSSWQVRWVSIRPSFRKLIFSAVVLIAIYKVGATLLLQPRVQVHGEEGFFQGLFALRPLLLFAEGPEKPYLLILGGLMIITVVMAVRQRLRTRISLRSDALLLAALLLLLTSVISRTPNAHLLYIGIRAQTLGLLLLMAWAATVVPSSRWTWAIGLAVLVIHVGRLVYVERTMAGSRPTYERAMEVVGHLPRHGVALAIVRDDNWMHEHLSAFVAASHEGVFFSSGDHLAFHHHPSATDTAASYSFGFPEHLRWLERHVATHASPEIDHIVIFGHGRPTDLRFSNALAVLQRHYLLQWTNDYAEVWVRRTDE